MAQSGRNSPAQQFSDDLINLMHLRDVTVSSNVTEQRGAGRNRRVQQRWRRLGPIGRGSFSTVFKEQNDADGSVRAVKQVGKDARNMYQREIGALTMFSRRPDAHDLFVGFHGWYEYQDSAFLLLDYMEHGDLGRWMNQAFPEIEAQDIAHQLLGGLSVLHEAHFIHRDLKPGNILVASMAPWVVKIGDFGTGRRLLDRSSDRNTFVGTIAYQAPEYYHYSTPGSGSDGSTAVHGAVDIWSLGCIVYELLTARQPFHGQLLELKQYCDGEIPFPEDHLFERNVSTRAIDLIRSMLIPHPSLRTNANDALTSLWLDSDPETSPTPPQDESDIVTARADVSGSSPGRDQAGAAEDVPEMIPDIDDGDGNFDGVDYTMTHSSPAATLTRMSLDGDQESPSIHTDSASILSRSSTWSRGSTVMGSVPPALETVVTEFRNYGQSSRSYLYRLVTDIVSSLPRSRLHGLSQRPRHGLDAVAEILLSPSMVDVTPGILLQAMFRAVKDGQQDAVRMMVAMGADVNAAKPEAPHRGDTPLIMAAWFVEEGMIKCLINLGADPNLRNINKGHTALFCAAARGQEYMMRGLLDIGADPTLATPDGWTPLHLAAQEGRPSVIRVLLENGTDVHATTTGGLTALHCAAQGGYSDVVSGLLIARAKPNVKTSEGLTPLHLTARHGDEKTTRLLLAHGANPRGFNHNDRQTPLHIAASCGHDKVVQALLTYHAETEAKDKLGKTAMHYAAVCNRSEPLNMIRALYLHGAKCSVRDRNGDTPAMIADWPEVKRELITFAKQQKKLEDGDEDLLEDLELFPV